MDYEKKYKNALEWARGIYPNAVGSDREDLEHYFPELKESEDERIRNDLKRAISVALDYSYLDKECANNCLAWLEKQGEINLEHYKDGENEKRKFVGYGFLKCKGDFLAFKEGETYWLEYVGKDNYNVRSDNLLGQTFHIKPIELYTVFRPTTWLEKQGEPIDKGEISDGYHTFNELYYYRMLYNAAFFNLLPKEWVHKSKRHHDGEECFGGGWFIVMANLPTGQISNHYELKDWELFQIPEKEVADEWDGHTPQEAAERLHKYLLEKQSQGNLTALLEQMPCVELVSSNDGHYRAFWHEMYSEWHESAVDACVELILRERKEEEQ